MIVLRDYQASIVDEVRAAFGEGHKSVLLQLPTGGGKTLTAGFVLSSAARMGNNSMFICNRVELLEQTAKAFDKLDIRFGIIAAGYTGDPGAPVQIASIDTLKRRLDRVVKPRIVVWDECRGLGAGGWTKVFAQFPDAAHLGLDATPVRLDGKGLGAYFTKMVLGPTYSELMAIGALVPFKVFAPSTPDMTGVKKSKGDFDHAQTEAIMDKPTLTGDIVDHYRSHAGGKLGITFAVSRRHSEHLAEQYRLAGIPAAHLDGDTDKAERTRTVAAFRRRELQMLTNVNLFSAGFDVPGVEVIVDAAPTQSLAMYMQRAGRGSRPEPEIGKTNCVLLDHAGNVFRHGLPDQDREWSLDGLTKKSKKKKAEDEVSIRQCRECFAVFAPAPVCPVCGAAQKVTPREVEQVDGQLSEITPEMARAITAQKKNEVQRARTLEALQAIEQQRNYSAGWAEQVFRSRARAENRRVQNQFDSYWQNQFETFK